MRQYTADFEPAATQPFDDLWERKLTSVQQVKGELSLAHFIIIILRNLIALSH
jgi:hypothetical protein